MNKPRSVPGSCQFYDHTIDKCYLSETTPSSGTRDQKCKSDSKCKNCGNYEAWESGSNYRGK
ncbi:MAG: hypothetical protein LBH16_07265 [Treponema sp.]|jgi:hypothetical protein|nr:hypothetical protein [Treponema sp.]